VSEVPVVVDSDEDNEVQDTDGGQSESKDTSGSVGNLESSAHGSLAFISASVVGKYSDSHSDESCDEGSEGSQEIGNGDPAVSEGFFDEAENE